MNLKQVIQEINKRCSTNFDEYNERAKTYFIISISDLINSEKYTISDYKQLINNIKTSISFDERQEYTLHLNNSVKNIIDVKINKIFIPGVDNINLNDRNYTISIIDKNKIKFIKTLNIKPNYYFIYNSGKSFIIYGSNIYPVEIDINYLWLPHINSWKDNQDLSLFSTQFLFDCIDLATQKLLIEQKG